MTKILFAGIISLPILFGHFITTAESSSRYSTLAVVTLSGSIVKSRNTDIVQKYKRKDCPVCKGKGWYMSGDGIAKIICQYCE